jgi:hypothetical protein
LVDKNCGLFLISFKNSFNFASEIKNKTKQQIKFKNNENDENFEINDNRRYHSLWHQYERSGSGQ